MEAEIESGISTEKLERLMVIGERRPKIKKCLSWMYVAQNGCWVWMDKKNCYGRAVYRGRAVHLMFLSALRKHNKKTRYRPTYYPKCDTAGCVNPEHWSVSVRRSKAVPALDGQAGTVFETICEVLGVSFPLAANQHMGPREQIATFLLTQLLRPGLSYQQIGALIGHHHASVMYTERLVRDRGEKFYGVWQARLLARLMEINDVSESAAA